MSITSARATLAAALISAAVSLVGILFSVSASRDVERVKADLERYQATAVYTQILGNTASPAYVRSLALASMYRFNLADTDFLFDVAYEIENREWPGAVKSLLYAYGRSDAASAKLPIGSIQFNPRQETGTEGPGAEACHLPGAFYHVIGWTLDVTGIREIHVFRDDKVLVKIPAARFVSFPGLHEIFPRYPSVKNSGFGFCLAAEPKRRLHLVVRVFNNSGYFRDIVDRDLETGSEMIEFVRRDAGPQLPKT